ncbi:hypothetical protein EII19_12530 [Comamonadaceae bacterium OH2310_COT-174]|nr:hypothetical protein EII19_12530 [Comamonadaceae bacterium OH2310_COT-174]
MLATLLMQKKPQTGKALFPNGKLFAGQIEIWFLFYRPIGRGPHGFMPSRWAADLEWLRAAAMATTIAPIWQNFGDDAAKAHPKTGAARWKLLQTWLAGAMPMAFTPASPHRTILCLI